MKSGAGLRMHDIRFRESLKSNVRIRVCLQNAHLTKQTFWDRQFFGAEVGGPETFFGTCLANPDHRETDILRIYILSYFFQQFFK